MSALRADAAVPGTYAQSLFRTDPEEPKVVEAPRVRDIPSPPAAITSGGWSTVPMVAPSADEEVGAVPSPVPPAAGPMPDDSAPNPQEPTPDGDGGHPDPADDVQEYLDTTRRIVEEGASELTTMVAGIVDSLATGDLAAAAAFFASDEGAGPDDVSDVLDALPPGAQVSPPGSVEVLAVDEATVYFVYCLVGWTDGGIQSEHTIVVPLRFVDGEWRLTTIDERIDGLVPVQVVQL